MKYFSSFLQNKTMSVLWQISGTFGTFTKITFFFSIVSLLVIVRIQDFDVLKSIRFRSFDLYQQIQPRENREDSPVVIADIDEKSLQKFGQWPFPRTYLANLIDALKEYDAKAVGFDMVFAEPDRTSPKFFQDAQKNYLSAEALAQIENLPDNDVVFSASVQDFPTVLGRSASNDSLFRAANYEQNSTDCNLANESSVQLIWHRDYGCPLRYMLPYKGLIKNLPVLEQGASGIGVFSIPLARDGIIRRVPIIQNIRNAIHPALSIELIRVAFAGKSIVALTEQGNINNVIIQGSKTKRIPVDGEQNMWVYFSKPDLDLPTPYLYISIADIITKRVPKERLKDKIVLVGTSATGLLDYRATPISPRLPGVEVHANLIENILAEQFLTYPIEMTAIELIVLIIVSIFMITFIPRAGAWYTLFGTLILLFLLVAGSWYLFSTKLLLLDVTYTVIVSLSLFILGVFLNYVRDEAEKIQIRSAFRQYLSPDMVNEISNNPQQLRLGGDSKNMTFLFCDIRKFTAIAEQFKNDPQSLTQLINSILTPLTRDIMERKGTIDKYMGDCIMAFWNAPISDPKHRENACYAALRILKSIDIINHKNREVNGENALPIEMGVGINSGNCVVGNMGSEQRFDYSVIGDSVNLASRLEGQSKFYGVTVIVGEDTVLQQKEPLAFVELDSIAVKGKADATKIFTLVGDETLLKRKDFHAFLELHKLFLSYYRSQQWSKALETHAQIQKALQICEQNCLEEKQKYIEEQRQEKTATEKRSKQKKKTNEVLSLNINTYHPAFLRPNTFNAYYAMMKERIEEYCEHSPGENWDGVYVATSK